MDCFFFFRRRRVVVVSSSSCFFFFSARHRNCKFLTPPIFTLDSHGCFPNHSTGQRKNYGFVTFESEEALTRAVSLLFSGCFFEESIMSLSQRRKGKSKERRRRRGKKKTALFLLLLVLSIFVDALLCACSHGRARLPWLVRSC